MCTMRVKLVNFNSNIITKQKRQIELFASNTNTSINIQNTNNLKTIETIIKETGHENENNLISEITE